MKQSQYFVVSRKWNNPEIHINYDGMGVELKIEAHTLVRALARSMSDELIGRAMGERPAIPHPLFIWTRKALNKALGHARFEPEPMEELFVRHFGTIVDEMKQATIYAPPRS